MLKCHKTPGGHRKFEIRNVVEFAEANHFEPAGALEIAGSDGLDSKIQVAVLSRDYPLLVESYVRRALTTDGNGLFPFLSYLYQHCMQIWELHDRVIRPAMEEIGGRWSRGEIGVAEEHRASYETLEALAKLQLQIRIKPPSGRSVVCATIGDELHEIGLRCAAYLFESEGWGVHYLGSRIPADAVCAAIERWQPDIVCLSSTVSGGGDHAGDLVNIAAAAERTGAVFLAGGRHAGSLTQKDGSPDASRNSSQELLCFIQGVARTGSPCSGGDPHDTE